MVLNLGLGKQFQKQGVDTCYVYIEAASKGYINIIRNFLEEINNKQKEIQEQNKPKKGIAPEGKQVITGTILGLPCTENYYGIQLKMFVELENGSTVYGSLPSKLYEAEIGDKIQFSANFTHAEKDNTHAFFKRPTKPQFIKD